jgi:hypothetical protein
MGGVPRTSFGLEGIRLVGRLPLLHQASHSCATPPGEFRLECSRMNAHTSLGELARRSVSE